MERIVEQTMLYDFYGELLNEHQRAIFEEVVLNDMSLSEVAEVHGVSRQGVHDLIRRCSRQMEEYESRLHLVERFRKQQELLHQMHELTLRYAQSGGQELLDQLEVLYQEMLQDL